MKTLVILTCLQSVVLTSIFFERFVCPLTTFILFNFFLTFFTYFNLFLTQDEQDVFLEQERDKALTKWCILIQKTFRGWFYRRRFLEMRNSAILIQRTWRKCAQRVRFIKVHYSSHLFFRTLLKVKQCVYMASSWHRQIVVFVIIKPVSFNNKSWQ